MKALGAGIGGFALHDVEVVRGTEPGARRGAPSLRLFDRAAALAAEHGISKWHVSLTHTDSWPWPWCWPSPARPGPVEAASVRPVVSVAEMRVADAAAIRSVGESELIQRAGFAVATEALRMLGGAYGRRIVVLAGKGNNGNDGRVAAGALARRGAVVDVIDAASAPGRIDVVTS